MPKNDLNSRLRAIAGIVALAVIYFCAGIFGLSLAFANPNASAVWPSSGIALAAILVWGFRLWPGIVLGAFFVNFATQGSLWTALGIAAGNTSEALLAAMLLARFAQGANVFNRTRNILTFIFLAGIVSTAAGATIGAITLYLGGFIARPEFSTVWLTWWLGDAVGNLIITPLLLMWLTQPVLPVRSRHIFEAAGLLVAVISTSALLFLNPVPAGLEYFALVPLLWAALRFGRRGAVTAAFITSGIALWGTVRDLGPFAQSEPHESIFLLQLFIATISMTALIVASVVSQQQRLEQRLRIKDAVSRILSEASTMTEAAPPVIKAICETAAWDFGALWLVERNSNVLTCVEMWCLPSIDVSGFAAVTHEIKFARGIGLPGRVWNSATPAWITDVLKDSNFPRAPVAISVGFHGAVGFPIKIDDEVFGVLEFFSRETKERDEEFQEMVANLGRQFGQFVERQRAEAALRESEARLQLALSAGQMGAWEWNISASKITWSSSLEVIHGLKRGSFGGTFEDFKKTIHPEDLASVLSQIQTTLETRSDYDAAYRIVHPDGQIRWVEALASLSYGTDGRPDKLAGVCMDITDSRHQEEMLRRRTRSLEIINRVGNALAAELDLKKIAQIIIDAGREISGAQFAAFFYNVKDKTGESLLLYALSGAPDNAFEKFSMPRNTELFGPTFRGEGVIRIGDVLTDPRYGKNPPHHGMPKGHPPVRSYLSIPVTSRSGKVIGGLFFGHPEPNVFTTEAESIVTAIAAQASVAFDNANLYQTVQRRAEEFQKLIDTAPIGIAVATDAESKHIWGNPEFIRMVGTGDKENLSKTGTEQDQLSFKIFRNGIEVRAEDLPMQRAARDGVDVLDEELEIQRQDGTIINELCRATPLRDEHGNVRGCIGIFLNISDRKQADAALQHAKDDLARANEGLEKRIQLRTAELQMANAALFAERAEEKRLEQQLRQAQKMESMGTLASGIAHDFNNILNIIKGYASLLLLSGEDQQMSAEALQVIDETVERGAATVRQLLALARESNLQFEPSDLNEMLENLKTLLGGTLPKTIDIEVDLKANLPHAMADPNQLHQVFLNVCLNARDAMPHGGKLRLVTDVVAGLELRKIYADAKEKSYACVTLEDTGSGIDETVKHRIFEPFFTTKPQGHGSGLGLAVAYGIIANHCGFIEVASQPDQGATFRIYLPLAETSPLKHESKIPSHPERPENISTAGQLVLFVDDEKNQVKLMNAYLESAGYRVLTAFDGVEAVETFRRYKDQIAVVVLDLGLPKLNGWDVLKQMKIADPTIKPILASGYVSAEVESALDNGELSAVIFKPYKLDEIKTAVAAAAGERRTLDVVG
jgi:PAS domain S-box-containing protein